jgi:ADP-dependent NAD(P)H-hydrate dehydratase
MRKPAFRIRRLSTAALRRWPLPMPDADGDKAARGRILVIGGSSAMPGGVVLAANAALRAGAGKLAIATGRSVAALVAVAIPEARVMALSESRSGCIAPAAVRSLDVDDRFDAVLVGPGMENENATRKFVEALMPKVAKSTLVLDARALSVLIAAPTRAISRFSQPVILTPNAGEMAGLSGTSKEAIEERPFDEARTIAEQWNAVVVLKGATTVVAAPDGRVWNHDKPNVGLAISGSGDTLAGIIAGLAARGAPAEQAAAWGVVLHALAGASLMRRFGRLGYLARELPAEVPRLMSRLG